MLFEWRTARRLVIPLEDGARGTGSRRGEVGVGTFYAGVYPACSRHGAMNRVGREVWRCLAEGCNAGATVAPAEFDLAGWQKRQLADRCDCGLWNPGPEHRANYPALCAERRP